MAGRWQRIQQPGCSGPYMPPRGMRVLFFYPSTWCAQGQKDCGALVFGRQTGLTLGLGVSPEGTGIHEQPSHWMYVAKP
jgi:hypothetical protein